jgi:hypothetical protein
MPGSVEFSQINGQVPIEVFGVDDPAIAQAYFYVTRGGFRDGLAFNFARLFTQPSIVWVDTVNGADGRNGASPEQAVATMAAAFALASTNGFIYVTGDVREHVTAPLGVYGVKIVGITGGRARHDHGVRWRPAAVAGDAPLLTLREQGWEVHNVLFVPQNTHSAIRCWRAEDAVHPDSSHFIVANCKFIGPNDIGGAQGIGVEDWGGNHHYLIQDCEFNDLEFAIVAPAGSPGIAAPLRDTIQRCYFESNKHDICMDMSKGRVLDNTFRTAYHVTAHPNTINLAYTSDVTGRNLVKGNSLADIATDVTIAHGYKPSTGDTWRNQVTNTAADIVAVPI